MRQCSAIGLYCSGWATDRVTGDLHYSHYFSSSSVLHYMIFTTLTLRVCRPAREPRTGKPPKVLPRVLSGVLSEIGVLPRVLPRVLSRVLPSLEKNRKSTLESTLGSTFGVFLVLGSLAGRQTLNPYHHIIVTATLRLHLFFFTLHYHQHQNVCNIKKIPARNYFVKITKNIFQR